MLQQKLLYSITIFIVKLLIEHTTELITTLLAKPIIESIEKLSTMAYAKLIAIAPKENLQSYLLYKSLLFYCKACHRNCTQCGVDHCSIYYKAHNYAYCIDHRHPIVKLTIALAEEPIAALHVELATMLVCSKVPNKLAIELVTECIIAHAFTLPPKPIAMYVQMANYNGTTLPQSYVK